MPRSLLAPILASMIAATIVVSPVAPALAATPPETWDNLVEVQTRKFELVYLAPGADFRGFTKVMLDPTEIAFHRNFARDFNRNATGISNRIQDSDIRRMTTEAREGFERVFRQAYESAGYQVVTEPAPDVLRVRTAVLDLFVTAPDLRTPGRSRSYSRDAGRATLVLEVRDSVSGAILGRAVDRRIVGDMGSMGGLRNSATNRGDFERTFRTWAQRSVDGLAVLRENSPIAEPATPAAN